MKHLYNFKNYNLNEQSTQGTDDGVFDPKSGRVFPESRSEMISEGDGWVENPYLYQKLRDLAKRPLVKTTTENGGLDLLDHQFIKDTFEEIKRATGKHYQDYMNIEAEIWVGDRMFKKSKDTIFQNVLSGISSKNIMVLSVYNKVGRRLEGLRIELPKETDWERIEI